MLSQQTLERLLWHVAPYTEREQAVIEGVPSIAAATASDAPAHEVETAVADVFDTLTLLNHELNGPTPSENTDPVMLLPRQLVYAMAEIIEMLRECRAEGAARRVGTAWMAILAGDIDDISEHVRLEEEWRP
jgi:hypothetical protein